MTRRRRRSQAGFTMIEVMVAILLTAIAVIGVVGLYRVQTRSSSFSRRTTEAAVLAADKMETLRTTITPTSSVSDETTLDARGKVGSGVYTRRWLVTPSGPGYQLDVTVLWTDEATTRQVKLYSVRGP